MSDPKEPMFFNRPEEVSQRMEEYQRLFARASDEQLCGESSTGYTKLPDEPGTVDRIAHHLPDARFVYMIRHPIDRLVSHYIHAWSQREFTGSIEAAVSQYTQVVDFGRYAMQLAPYLESFGQDRLLLVFSDRLRTQPQREIERVGRFLGLSDRPVWREEAHRSNVSAERMRKSRLRDALVYAPGISQVRQALPRRWRNTAKRLWQKRKRPELAPDLRDKLEHVFDRDLERLGNWLGVELTCSNFKAVAAEHSGDWKAVSPT